VDSLVEVSISARDGNVEVSMEVTRVLGISTDSDDVIELEEVSKRVGETVDSSDCTIEFVMYVDILCSVVEVLGKIDVSLSVSSVDDNVLSTTFEVLVMILLVFIDVVIAV
jgi:hypothetical protein